MKKLVLILISLFFVQSAVAATEWRVELESGLVYSGYNNVQIPRDTGTRFSLVDDLTTESEMFYRFRAFYAPNDRHSISLLIAPLTLHSGGSVSREILYEGTTFPANSALSATYTFNSYRLTYRYNVKRSSRLRIDLGLTAKIRDAAIRIESESLKAEKTNVGFVPLLSFRIDMLLSRRLVLLLDGDALAAPQGRAEDILFAMQYDMSNHVSLYSGYRILEGGANVTEVYNFALLHYLAFGISIRP